MDMNLFSIIWICGFCFGGAISIAVSINLKRYADNLISKCTSNCNGVLSEIGEEVREYQDENNHERKKHFISQYMSLK